MVTRPSAIHAGPRNRSYAEQPIHADHSQVVKFSDRLDNNYRNVEGNLKQWVEEAPEIVEKRFTPKGSPTNEYDRY